MNFVSAINSFKKDKKGLMSTNQYMSIGEVLAVMAPCNFLVFGLGEDSHLWEEINVGGRTTFLEDDAEWSKKFDQTPLEIYNVEYHTQGKDHEKIGFDEKALSIDLPRKVEDERWDLIFVDGPLGHNPPRPYKGPGRMSSIYMASKLLKTGGIAIVDDFGRLIENKYAQHFFGSGNLWKIVEKKVAFFKNEGR
tara:strand:+ start:1395 stop:1973 length:579 start_codon:yes stop_codon:yes gene_type:complete